MRIEVGVDMGVYMNACISVGVSRSVDVGVSNSVNKTVY